MQADEVERGGWWVGEKADVRQIGVLEDMRMDGWICIQASVRMVDC